MKAKQKVSLFLYDKLGDDYGGTPSPPGTSPRLEFGDPDDDGRPMHVATTYNNDGFEIWLGYRNAGWNVFYNEKHARKLAVFILWDWWAKSTWFGLKRKIWYWALREEVKKMKEWKRPATGDVKANGH